MAPAGDLTRPTAARVRQALFDMLSHAPWAGRGLLHGAHVLDGFAGTGALGLEALSRGAATATFIENLPAALAALRCNIDALTAGDRAIVHARDMRHPPKGTPQTLIFLDPPYDSGLLDPSIDSLRATGWIDSGTIIVAESAQSALSSPNVQLLAHRIHGAAQLTIWRETPS